MWGQLLVMVIPCILSLAFLGATLQKLPDFRLILHRSHRIDDPQYPDQRNNTEFQRSTPLVFFSSYGILLPINDRERTCHWSHRIQNYHRVQRGSGIQ